MKKLIVSVFLIIFTICFVGTQAFAYITSYNRVLDSSIIFYLGNIRIYNPFIFPVWYFRYKDNSPYSISYSLKVIRYSLIPVFMMIIGIMTKKGDTKNVHGSARWATTFEILRKKIAFRKYKDGVILGKIKIFGIFPYIIVENLLTHLILIAKSRSGKGTGIIVPTMLNWLGSIFVLDIKGENFERSSAFRQKYLKQKILRISPYSIENSTHYNPLPEIRIGSSYEVRDAEIIAEILSAPTNASKMDANSEHFITAGKSLFTGLFIYVLYKDRNASLADVYDVLTDPDAPFRDRAEEIMNESFTGYEEIIENIYKNSFDLSKYDEGVHPVVAAAMADFLNKPEKEAGSVVSTALTKLNLFKDPIIRKNMGTSDFKMTDIMDYETPVSVYMCAKEEELTTLSPIIRIFITQLLGISTRQLKHKHRLLMLLDEFPAFGAVPLLEKGLGYLAQYKIKLLIIAQTINQIKEVYGEKSNIIAGCATGIYYAPSQTDEATQKYISNILGSKTSRTQNINYKQFADLTGGNVTVNKTGQKLLTPDETANIGEDKAIIVTTGLYPILAKKIEFFNEKYFKDKYYDKERGVNTQLGEATVDKIN